MTPLDVTTLVVSFVVGIAIPWVTEAVSRSGTPEGVKSMITVGLSALVGAVSVVAVGDYADWQAYLTAIGAAWVASMRSYFAGLAKPVQRAKTVPGEVVDGGKHTGTT